MMNRAEKQGFLGSGWAFPISFSDGNHELKLTKYHDNINDNIDIILKTNFGERVMQKNFGSGLRQYFFKNMDETLKSEIRSTVKTSLLRNEPRITVNEVTVEYDEEIQGLVRVHIQYEYNRVNTRHNYVFPFYVVEGTNIRI